MCHTIQIIWYWIRRICRIPDYRSLKQEYRSYGIQYGVSAEFQITSPLTIFQLMCGLPKKDLGGGFTVPPLYVLIVIQIFNIWYMYGKPLCFTSIICQKNCKFTKFVLFMAKSSFLAKNVQNKKCANYDKLYIFEKLLPSMQKCLQNFIT